MSLSRNPCVAINATVLVMWPKIAETKTNVPSATENIVRNDVHPLLNNVQTATVSTRLVISNAPDIAGNQQSSNLKPHQGFPMPRLVDYTDNRPLLSISKPCFPTAQETFQHRLLYWKEVRYDINRFQLQNPVRLMGTQTPYGVRNF